MKGAIIAGVIALAAGSAGGFFIGRDAGFREGEQSGDRDALNKKINRAEALARDMEAARDELDKRVKARDEDLKKWSEKDLAKEAEKAKGDAAAAKSEADGLKAAKTQLENENQALKAKEAQGGATAAELEALKKKDAETTATLKEAKLKLAEAGIGFGPPLPVIGFGKAGAVDEVQKADWRTMGMSAYGMRDALGEFYREMMAGKSMKDIDMTKAAKIQEQNGKLVSFGAKAKGKLSAVAPGVNGTFAHPITTANLMAAALDAAGKPLTDQQRQAFSDIGLTYEKEWDAAQASYGPETYALQKLLDELRLRAVAVDSMRAALTQEQRAELVSDEMRNTGFDLYSPVISLSESVGLVTGETKEQLAASLKMKMQAELGLPAGTMTGATGHIADDFIAQLEQGLKPVPTMMARFFSLDTAQASGAAYLGAVQKLVKEMNLSGDALNKVRDSAEFFVPVLIAPEKAGG